MKLNLVILLVISSGLCIPVFPIAHAGDWPQILGPLRNGTAADEELASQWPNTGPKTVWEYKIGSGYAGPAVVGNNVIVFHRVGDVERLESLEAESGERKWFQDFDANYAGGVDADKGPRCVPLVYQGKVFAFGAAGTLHCVDLATGEIFWSRDLYGDYRGDWGYFGAGTSPIAVAGEILVNVGGKEDAGLVAVSIADGTTKWKTSQYSASYSSPIQITDGAKKYIFFITRLDAVLVDPTNGQVIDSIPFGKRGPTVNAAVPLQIGNQFFLTASYRVGAALVRMANRKFEVVWQNDDVLSSQYNTPVQYGSYLLGIHGREDVGRAELRCVEIETGQVRWSETNFGVAHLILAGENVLALKSDGTLVLLAASVEQYEPISNAQIFDHEARALPALSNGRLFARNNRYAQSTLRCFQVGRSKELQ